MRERELAHTFNDVRDIALSGRRIRWVEASRIEEDRDIGVVFFKQNLSTGWDCPRAEVMMSFRRAQDDTYIAQLLGRMVRTPLARRIVRDSALNDVHLLLPNFDTESVARVVKALQDPDQAPPASEVASARELVTLTRREGLDDVFDVLESLTTVRVNAARAQSPVRRLVKLGRALTYDELDLSAGGHARALLVQALVRERDAMSTAGTLAAAVNAVLTVQVCTLTIDHFDGVATAGGSYAAATASGDVDALFEQAGRALSNGLHMEWWQADPDRDSQEAKAELVVLCRDGAVMQRLESKAQGELDRLLREWRGAIRGLPESRRQHYDQLRLADAKPVSMDWSLPQNIPFRRQPGAPAFDRHLFVEAGNVFRAELSGWEREVVAEMLSGDETVAWLRNLARQPWSLEVPYETGSGARPMFPDMVVIRRASTGYAVDVLEPHDPSLDDNVAKAHGLARFGQEHGAGFARIGLVRKLRVAQGVEAYRLLDCCDAETARRVLLAATSAALDQLFTDRGVQL